jgi:hypothetical protein
LIPVFREEYPLMLYDLHDDCDVTELVAQLLGETAEFIRRRGFHLVELTTHDDEPDLVDLAELTGGLDWDCDVEPRLTRGKRSDRAA